MTKKTWYSTVSPITTFLTSAADGSEVIKTQLSINCIVLINVKVQTIVISAV